MNLSFADVNAIPGSLQRSLAKDWYARRRDGGLPSFIDWTVDKRNELTDQMACEVVLDAPSPRYLIRYHGETMGKAFGANCAGKNLNDCLPGPMREDVLQAYDACVKVHTPVYVATHFVDATPIVVAYEKLLMPFGNERVSEIITSVHLSAHRIVDTAIPRVFDQTGRARSTGFIVTDVAALP